MVRSQGCEMTAHPDGPRRLRGRKCGPARATRPIRVLWFLVPCGDQVACPHVPAPAKAMGKRATVGQGNSVNDGTVRRRFRIRGLGDRSSGACRQSRPSRRTGLFRDLTWRSSSTSSRVWHIPASREQHSERPKLTISVEPLEAGRAVFLALAVADQKASSRIVLRLRITNYESKNVVVSSIDDSFPGSDVPPQSMQRLNLNLDPDGPAMPAGTKGVLEPGQTATWSNGLFNISNDPEVPNIVSNVVYFPSPAPPKITVNVFCRGFSSPASVTLDLSQYTKPTPDGAFWFPFGPGDLRQGEYLVTSAVHWAYGGTDGGQIFAHDISVQGRNPNTHDGSELLPGGSAMKNQDCRIWGKPVRAVAYGTVEEWTDGMETNTITAGPNSLQFPTPAPSPVSGNHFWIRHGDDGPAGKTTSADSPALALILPHIPFGSPKSARAKTGSYRGRACKISKASTRRSTPWPATHRSRPTETIQNKVRAQKPRRGSRRFG